jgi:hypothetical protein
MAPSNGYAIPTWYNTGNYVVYDSQVSWFMTTTVSDANTRWQINMSTTQFDPSMPVLVQPLYYNATLGIQMTQRILATATWTVTESQDLLVIVRTYLHEARSFNDTTVIGRYTVKGAVWTHDLDATYPDLFIGFDPEYLRSNSHFNIGNMTYVNLGIEDVETPWGIRPAYHLLGKGFDLNDKGQNMTWDRWCDTSSGVVLRSDLREDGGTFGNLQYYERYREILTIREANFDITKFEEEPWYAMSFYGLPLWAIILILGAVAVVYVIIRRRNKPIQF